MVMQILQVLYFGADLTHNSMSSIERAYSGIEIHIVLSKRWSNVGRGSGVKIISSDRLKTHLRSTYFKS